MGRWFEPSSRSHTTPYNKGASENSGRAVCPFRLFPTMFSDYFQTNLSLIGAGKIISHDPLIKIGTISSVTVVATSALPITYALPADVVFDKHPVVFLDDNLSPAATLPP